MRELDIDVAEYSCCGGEYSEMSGRVPALVVECLEFLLKKFEDDPVAVELLKRLQNG